MNPFLELETPPGHRWSSWSMVDGDVFDDDCGDDFCDADVDDNIDDIWDISKYLLSLHHASSQNLGIHLL